MYHKLGSFWFFLTKFLIHIWILYVRLVINTYNIFFLSFYQFIIYCTFLCPTGPILALPRPSYLFGMYNVSFMGLLLWVGINSSFLVYYQKCVEVRPTEQSIRLAKEWTSIGWKCSSISYPVQVFCVFFCFSQKEVVREARKSWFLMDNLMRHIQRYIHDHNYIGIPWIG